MYALLIAIIVTSKKTPHTHTHTHLHSCISEDKYCSSILRLSTEYKVTTWLFDFRGLLYRFSRTIVLIKLSLCSVWDCHRTYGYTPPPPTHTHGWKHISSTLKELHICEGIPFVSSAITSLERNSLKYTGLLVIFTHIVIVFLIKHNYIIAKYFLY